MKSLNFLATAPLPDWSQWTLVIGSIIGGLLALLGIIVLALKMLRLIFRIEEALPTLLATAERLQKEDLWARLDSQDNEIAELHRQLNDLKHQLEQVQGTVSTPSTTVQVNQPPVAQPAVTTT